MTPTQGPGIYAPNAMPPCTLIWGRRGGRLEARSTYYTGITGHSAKLDKLVLILKGRRLWLDAELYPDGRLVVEPDTTWDFGSGAVDTPPVIIASLAHDMLCHMTNMRLLPWRCRWLADRAYRVMLRQNGACLLRAWGQWAFVAGYSQLIASWRDRIWLD